MTTEPPEIIILRYGDIEIRLPKSIEDIHRAKKLLDMLDYELTKKVPEWDYNVLDEKPQGTPQTIVAHSVITPQIEAKPISAGDPDSQIHQEGKLSENPPERILSDFSIPKFEWDKTKEKSYRTIFFYEHEDKSRVMIFYQNSRVFTTKEAVITIPYPVPKNYAPLRSAPINKKTALKFYREYLAENGEQGAKAQAHEGMRAAIEEKDKGIFEDIQLYNDENKDEDEIMGEAAKEAEEKRTEKLKKAAKVNSSRWKDRVENEASPRTQELRSKFALKAPLRGL